MREKYMPSKPKKILPMLWNSILSSLALNQPFSSASMRHDQRFKFDIIDPQQWKNKRSNSSLKIRTIIYHSLKRFNLCRTLKALWSSETSKDWFFARNILDRAISQKRCMGLWYYCAVENEHPMQRYWIKLKWKVLFDIDVHLQGVSLRKSCPLMLIPEWKHHN